MRQLVVRLGIVAFAVATGAFAAVGCVDSPRFVPPGDDPAPTSSSTTSPGNGEGGADGGTDTGPVVPALPQYTRLLDGTCTDANCDPLDECSAPQGGGSTLFGTKCFSSDGQCKGPANADKLRNVYGCYDTGLPIWIVDSKCGAANAKDPNADGNCQDTTGIAACEIEAGTDVAGTACASAGTRCALNQILYACSPGKATSNAVSQLCEDAAAGNCAGLAACTSLTPGGTSCTVEGTTCVVPDDLPTPGATSTAGKAYTCIRR
jgi:hypothetical protein